MSRPAVQWLGRTLSIAAYGETGAGALERRNGVTAGMAAPSLVRLPAVDEGDLMVRNLTYRLFVDLDRAPSTAEVAAAGGVDGSEVQASWARLHDAHAIVLDRETGGLRMVNRSGFDGGLVQATAGSSVPGLVSR
jgi:hypothetical protein